MEHAQNLKIDLDLILKDQKITPGKKKVLLASVNLFSQYGFHAVSTAAIAKSANVSEGTIFKYFKSKRGLLLAIITPILEYCIPTYEDLFVKNIEAHNQNLKSLIHFIVEDRIQFFKSNREIVAIILGELIVNEEIRTLLIESLKDNHKSNGENILKIFQDTNELASDITYSSLLRIVMGQLLMYFTQIYLFKSKKVEKEQLIDQIYRALKKKGI